MMWLFFMLGVALANEPVTLKKGEQAPFSGTLLSPQTAAQLLANYDIDVATCKANAARDVQIAVATGERNVALESAKLTACQYQFDQSKIIYEQHVEFLERQAKRPNWETPVSFIGGVAVGIAVVTLSAWTLDKIQEN
jgi:hypothetical protein